MSVEDRQSNVNGKRIWSKSVTSLLNCVISRSIWLYSTRKQTVFSSIVVIRILRLRISERRSSRTSICRSRQTLRKPKLLWKRILWRACCWTPTLNRRASPFLLSTAALHSVPVDHNTWAHLTLTQAAFGN